MKRRLWRLGVDQAAEHGQIKKLLPDSSKYWRMGLTMKVATLLSVLKVGAGLGSADVQQRVSGVVLMGQ